MFFERLFRVKKVQLEMIQDRGYDLDDEAEVLASLLDDNIEDEAKLSYFKEFYWNRGVARLGEQETMGLVLPDNIPEFINATQSDASLTLQKIRRIFTENGLSSLYNKTEEGKPIRIYVFYAEWNDFSPAKERDVRNFFTTVTQLNKPSQGVETPYTKYGTLITSQPLSSQSETEFKGSSRGNFQTFTHRQLESNPTHHALVPKHEFLGNEESQEYKKKASKTVPISGLPIMLRSDPICRYFDGKAGQLVRIYRKVPAVGTAHMEIIYYRIIR